MLKRLIVLLLSGLLTLLLSTVPAFAISSISNSFSAHDYTINTGQTVYFHAKTVYGWVVIPNPYTSNFVTELNAYHFNRPQTYGASGLSSPNSWYYFNPGMYTSPCYRYHSYFWIIPPQTKYLKFTAGAKDAASGSRRGHRHGQSRELNWDISYGSPAWIYTIHN